MKLLNLSHGSKKKTLFIFSLKSPAGKNDDAEFSSFYGILNQKPITIKSTNVFTQSSITLNLAYLTGKTLRQCKEFRRKIDCV